MLDLNNFVRIILSAVLFMVCELFVAVTAVAGCTDDSQICSPSQETVSGSVVMRQYDLDFLTRNQSMVGPNESTTYQSEYLTIVDRNNARFSRNITVGGISDFCLDDYINRYFGSITAKLFRKAFSNPCYSYGAQMRTGIFADFGVDMRFSLDTGEINIDYPMQVDFNYPATDSFHASDWVTIDEQFQVNTTQTGFSAQPPGGAIDFTIKGRFDTDGWGKGCIDDCSSRSLWDFDQDGSRDGTVISGVAGTRAYFSKDGWPIGTDNILGFMAGTEGFISIPLIDQFSSTVNGRTLVGNGSDRFVDMSVDLGTWFFRILNAPFFISKAVKGGSVSLEGAALGYKVFTSDVDIRSTMHQRFEFTPTFHKSYHFSEAVNWQVIEAGEVVRADTGENVVVNEGQSLQIQSNQITPVQMDTYIFLTNTISKNSWIKNESDMDVEALDFLFTTPSWTIFNERCIGSGWTKVCLPRLGWNGSRFDPDPALDVEDIAPVEYDYPLGSKTSWQIGGFQNFQLASYTLDPNQTPVLEQVFGLFLPALGDTLDIDLMAGFSDPDANTLTISVDHLPAGFSITQDNHLVGTITADIQDTILVIATDPLGDSISQNIVIDARMALVDIGDGIVVSETGTTDQFQLRLNRQPGSPVQAILSSSADVNLGAGFGQPSTVTFDSSNWNIPQMVTITALDDSIAEIDQLRNVTITLSQPGGTFDGKSGATVLVSILNDDQPGYVVVPANGLITTEDGGQTQFDVMLTSQPTQDVVIQLQSSEILEATINPASLTFTAQNWNQPQTVTVTGQEDSPPQADGANDYFILNTATTSNDSFYQNLLIPHILATNMDNDTAQVIFSKVSSLITTEGGSEDRFSVRLSTQPISPSSQFPMVYIHFKSLDQSEIVISPASPPLARNSETQNIPQGAIATADLYLEFGPDDYDVPQEVIITGVDDTLDDGDILALINTDISVLSNETSYNTMTDADLPEIEVTNINDDFAALNISAPNPLVVSEAGTSQNVTVSLSVQPANTVTVNLVENDSTEVSVNPATLMFTSLNWNTPQTVVFTGIDDQLADETIVSQVDLIASSADLAYNALPSYSVMVTTEDNEVASITVNPENGLVTTEAGGQTSFTVKLDVQPVADVVIPVQVTSTGEISVSTSRLTFTPANWSQAQIINIIGQDDFIDDGDQNWTVQLLPTISQSGIWSGVDGHDVSGTNQDDDAFGVVVVNAEGLTVNEDGTTDTFSIQLNSQPVADVSFSLISSNPGIGSVTPAILVFTPLDWNILHSVSVQAIDNDLVEPVLSFNTQILASISNDVLYNNIDLDDPLVTRGDNDQSGILVYPASPILISETGTKRSFFIKLLSRPGSTVEIPLQVSDSSEASLNLERVSFTQSNWNQPQEVVVTGKDDNLVDGEKSFRIITVPAISADTAYANQDAIDLAVSTLDDEKANIIVLPTTPLIVGEDGTTAELTIALSHQPVGDVQISISSDTPSEVAVTQSLLTFTPVNWDSPQTVVVQGEDDNFGDQDQQVQLTIGPASSNTDAGFATSPVKTVDVTNVDDDTLGVVVVPATGLITSEAGGTARFAVRLSARPTSSIIINLSSSDTSEGDVTPSIITLTSDNWQLSQEVTITGIDDDNEDDDVDYKIVLAEVVTQDPNYAGIDPVDVLVTNTDNDLDTDQDGVTDEIEQDDDRDQDGVINKEDYDPTGYFYDSNTGEIIAGGSISISCDSGTPTFAGNLDGQAGYYQYFISSPGTPSVCTQSISPPSGYKVDEDCSDLGLLDVPAGPQPLVLGSDEVGNTGRLLSASCADNPWYSQLSIETGDAFVLNNNIPLVKVLVGPAVSPIPALSGQQMVLLALIMVSIAGFNLRNRRYW